MYVGVGGGYLGGWGIFRWVTCGKQITYSMIMSYVGDI